jgi:prophage tail gpP-like protein
MEVDGRVYEGWITARVTRSYFNPVPTFSLTYHDAWLENNEVWPMQPGAACVVNYGTFPLITGYVNHANWKLTSDAYTLLAEGRGATQDLVDCSATHAVGVWRNKSMRKIVSDLCAPFNIPVILSEPDSVNFKKFEIEEGETCYDAIERMARLRGYLVTTGPTGNLALVRTANPGRSVVFPVADAISRELDANDQDRYSSYSLSSQINADDEFGGDAATAGQVETTDAGVLRYRPLVLVGSAPGAKAELVSPGPPACHVRCWILTCTPIACSCWPRLSLASIMAMNPAR